jgi:hypothetical protein
MPVATAFRSFDSIPSGSRTQQQQQQQQEFSQQEVEFRPHLLFLGHYWQDPNSKSWLVWQGDAPVQCLDKSVVPLLGGRHKNGPGFESCLGWLFLWMIITR